MRKSTVIALSRSAGGSIDEAALTTEIRARLAAGATEVRFRGLTVQEAKRPLLEAIHSLLSDLALRLRGTIGVLLQCNDEGELRARIDGIDVGTLARQPATEAGLEGVRIEFRDAFRPRGAHRSGRAYRLRRHFRSALTR